MKAGEIHQVVLDFLEVVRSGDSVAENEEHLPLLLDRLALATHFASDRFDSVDHPDPPRSDQSELRSLVCRRFPNYGFYNFPASFTNALGEASCVVGDAIDDILDITNDLLSVEWRWSNTSESDALWHFQFLYKSHWRFHLRGLQAYLDDLESQSGESA